MHRILAAALFTVLAILTAPAAGQGTPIGFAETWALATDRAKVLDQLIPGTVDYYDYHCRHAQDTGAFDRVEPLLKAWIQRHGRSTRVVRIENRQALLTFEGNPAETLRFLQQRLNLRFDHERQIAGAKQDLATSLDQDAVSLAAFTTRALAENPHSVKGFRESGLERLLASDLGDELLLSLLSRLRRPDVAGLPALVVRNLQDRRSRGFGSLAIHQQLLITQLEECVQLRPALLNDGNFVGVYLRRLVPDEDVQWRQHPAEEKAYLTRLENFAKRLGAAHNSLKAHVLHRRLEFDLTQGDFDRERFLAYLRLPRRISYVRQEFLQRFRRSGELVNMNRGYPTGFPPIGKDEALVRAYLSHFFATADSYQPFAETVRSDYLRRLFAETKILNGTGDMERWYSMLDDPAYYEKLKERVEIEFAPTQRRYYGATEAVSIAVDVKNVDKLLVKVFEINTFNYYRKLDREVDASINLDGLVANFETTQEYSEGPLRRVRRTLDLPQLKNPGVYVVELIGNGLSSRAVVHKGRLQFTERLGAAGQVLVIRDETGAKVKGATVWFGGKEFRPDEAGEVLLPYSTSPGRRSLILRHGSQSSLASFRHLGESYSLRCGIHLDRESLLAQKRARILLRPSLRLNGRAVSLDILEDPVLTIRSKDRDGVEASLEVRDLKLSSREETVHEIQVPARLASLSVTLRGRVKNLSRGKTEAQRAPTRSFALNQIDSTAQTACPLLGRTDQGYVVDVLGKNGEPKVARAVRFSFFHEDFTDPILVTLKTDARGRIRLGALAGIVAVEATGLPKNANRWSLRDEDRTYPAVLHGVVGEILRVPFLGGEKVVTPSMVSLLETRGGQFVRDAFENVAMTEGFLELRRLAAGDYDLWLKQARRRIRVRITDGTRRDGWAIGRDRMLAGAERSFLQITEMSSDAANLRIQVANPNTETRVHVVATRYLTPFDAFGDLRVPGAEIADVVGIDRPDSVYHSGREIGDEYRYILARRFAKKYPGNMLQRPGLILNPWALDENAWNTAVGLGGGAGGRFGGRRGGATTPGPSAPASGGKSRQEAPGTFADLGFLPEPTVIVANLKVAADGSVTVPWADLGSGQQVHVVAVDANQTVYRTMVRGEQPLAPQDRRLAKALDATQHFTEQRRIDFVAKGGEAEIGDVTTARAQTYDSLASVYRLFATLSGNAELQEFAPLLSWPKLEPKQKREYYESHACHELHLFLHQKDPEFFRQVVRPYLANKAAKTFLDEWLLGANLDGYLEPWAFGQLNIVERILLARRLEDAAPAIQRHLRDLFELKERDPARLARLFDNAMSSGDLDEDAAGVANKLAEIRKVMRSQAPKPKKSGSERQSRLRSADKSEKAKRGRKSNADRSGGEREVEEEEALDEIAERQAPREEAKHAAPEPEDSKNRAKDLGRRRNVQSLYRAPDPTQPLVEHNYWHHRNVEHVASLVGVNAFWLDFATAGKDGPFVSAHLAEAAGGLTEMLLALAVIDLPFSAAAPTTEVDGNRLTIRAAGPLLLVRKELVAAAAGAADSPILVSQNYYRLDEPHRFEGNRRFDAYVTGEFLVDVAYGCRVVVTNPTSAPRDLELLLQIPEGALPLKNGFFTKGVGVALGAYATSSFEYAFYFPAAGTASHYPVHVAGGGKLVAFAAATALDVVPVPSKVDTSSWQYISQNGTTDQVLAYLDGTNLERVDLGKIAWRMREAEVFRGVLARLRARHVYDETLWSYGIRHGDASAIREYLLHQDKFLASCGVALKSPLVTIDPIRRHTYQHIEYEPLFNARAHQFGKRREILNRHFGQHYLAFLQVLGQRPTLDDADWMTVTYYMLLQDRIEDALSSFARVRPDRLPMRIQHDYMRAYLGMFTGESETSMQIAESYKDYPVLRWQKLFATMRGQLAEVQGAAVAQGDPDDRTQKQTALAAQEPGLELDVQARRVSLSYHNLETCQVRYYEMDVEFLFSTQPFVQQGSGSFAFIRPNLEEERTLPKGKTALAFDLPAQFENSNVLIEVSGAGVTRRKAYYANSLDIQYLENYGQLKVNHQKSGEALRSVYVKVFARFSDGKVRFYKDGYTDLRGRFDYASLSAQANGNPTRFSILILSEDHGAVIRELAPPAR